MRMPSTITVDIDTHEKKTLEFPKTFSWWDIWRNEHITAVQPNPVGMPTGDFSIRIGRQSYTSTILVERKGSWDELATNLFTRDRLREMAKWDRLAKETAHPVLLLDFPVSLPEKTRYTRNCPQVYDAILRETMKRGIHLLWWPPGRVGRRTRSTRTGLLLIHYMWMRVYTTHYLRT